MKVTQKSQDDKKPKAKQICVFLFFCYSFLCFCFISLICSLSILCVQFIVLAFTLALSISPPALSFHSSQQVPFSHSCHFVLFFDSLVLTGTICAIMSRKLSVGFTVDTQLKLAIAPPPEYCDS